MRVSTDVESLEGGTLAEVSLADVATARVIASVQLVVAQLKILVCLVVSPPRTFEARPIGEVTVQWIIFYRHIGDGAETIVAWHIGEIVEQIGLDAQKLSARFEGIVRVLF